MTEREMALRGRAPAPHQPPVNNRYFSRKWGVLYISVYSTIYNVVTCQVRIYNHYINAHIAIVSTVYCYIITCVSTICRAIYKTISNLILSIAMGQTALRIRNDITKAND